MPVYRIGPMALRSRVVFPELQLSNAAVRQAWTFRLTTRPLTSARVSWFHGWTFPDGRRWLTIGRASGGYLLRFSRVGSFLVDPARRTILGSSRRTVPLKTMRHLLLDQVIPMVLGADHLVVHASAVIGEHGAVAFVGPSGSGKSTVAAALARQGYSLVTDDCLVVDLKRRPAHVIPTYAGLRLWPDAMRALFPGPRPRRGEEVAHYSAK